MEIVDLAEGLWVDYAFNKFADLDLLLKENNISISYGDYGSHFDGLLECRNGKFHVFCNLSKARGKTSPRSRFTIAHELGHYYLDEHRAVLQNEKVPSHQSIVENFGAGIQTELEADFFASNLLMPPSKVRKFEKKGNGSDLVKILSSEFKSSITASALQYTKLSNNPIVVVKWENSDLKWCYTSPFASALGWGMIKMTWDLISRESATGQIIANHSDSNGTLVTERTTTLVSAWCRHVNQGSPKDVILIEDAIDLSEYGIITLLYPHETDRQKVEILRTNIVENHCYGF